MFSIFNILFSKANIRLVTDWYTKKMEDEITVMINFIFKLALI